MHADDQVLFQVECNLRASNPKLLATIYAKELHVFSIDSFDPPSPIGDFKIAQASVLSFSPKTLFKTNINTPSPLTTVLCVTFLKALKKLLILNLTMRKEIIPFGNAALLSNLDILEIEPKFIEESDVGISITKTPRQFDRLIDILNNVENINFKYAIHLAPSGIRAYLVEGSIEKSTTTKPSNYLTITDSLANLHNILIDPETCTWIKLIPNLSHLNGITTQISDYLKPVPNIKYLVWPLELCYIQKAHELNKSITNNLQDSMDPLSLINEFVNLKASSQTKTPSAVPTSNNTPLNLENHSVIDHPTTKNETPQNSNSIGPNNEPSTSPTVNSIPQVEESQEESNTDQNNWNYLNEELFGDGDDDDEVVDDGEVVINDSDFEFFDSTNNNENDDPTNNGDRKADDLAIDVDDLLDEDELANNLASELELLTEENNEKHLNEESNNLNENNNDNNIDDGIVEKNPYDIPLHEMTLTSTPTPYEDPGAPLPIISPKNRNKSIFSPLNFNPIIKANVDDKYGEGGKFFVGKNGESGFTTMSITDSFGQDEGDEEEDSDFTDDEDDEDDPEENGETDSSKSKDGTPSVIESTIKESTAVSEFEEKPSENLPDTTEPDQKKLKLSVDEISQIESDSPSTETTSNKDVNGVPNCMPFILRSIPLYTIPSDVFIDNPKIELEKIENTIDELLNQIVWNDTYSFEDIPSSAYKLFNENETIERSIAQFFPDIHKATLFEFSGFNKYNSNKNDEEDEMLNIGIESPLSSFQTPNLSNDAVLTVRNSLIKASSASFTTDPSDLASGNRNEDLFQEKKESSYVFPLKPPKMRVRRFSQELSVTPNSLYLWNLMSFRPLNKPKNLRVLLISSNDLIEQSSYFLKSFIEIYEYKFQLGKISKLSINEPNKLVNDGLIIVEKLENAKEKILESAVELKKDLSLRDEEENDEDEILIFYPDNNNKFISTLSEIQIFQEFKEIFRNKYKISLKMIPSSFITNNGVFSTVSTNKLGRLALNVYNSVGDKDLTFTELSTSLPETIDFKLAKQPIAGEFLSQESYIHLSYDRSIDKEWIVAAWTDEFSKFRKTKSWYCGNGKVNLPKIFTIEQVMNDIWDVTLKFSNKLKGKKHLILTRLNGMIPDDELLHLKRLSSKTRDLTLIVVSASDNSKLLLEIDDIGFPITKIFNQQSENEKLINIGKDSVPTVGSSTGLTPSTMFTPQGINSPDLFTMTRASITHESPSSTDKLLYDEQNTLVDICDTIYGVMIDSPETLANAPSRFSVKTGYLIKPIKNSANLIKTFEVNLLSCPSNFQNDELMKTLLTQFRNLSTISELFSVIDPKDSLLPWHVEAVKKAIRCLVHIRVNYEK